MNILIILMGWNKKDRESETCSMDQETGENKKHYRGE